MGNEGQEGQCLLSLDLLIKFISVISEIIRVGMSLQPKIFVRG